jgi:acetyl-CoA carboxylase biotin carboxyl carrier protein
MKLMNEIESEVDGTVLEVMVKNGDTVQYGDALFKLRVG